MDHSQNSPFRPSFVNPSTRPLPDLSKPFFDRISPLAWCYRLVNFYTMAEREGFEPPECHQPIGLTGPLQSTHTSQTSRSGNRFEGGVIPMALKCRFHSGQFEYHFARFSSNFAGSLPTDTEKNLGAMRGSG